MRSSSFKGCLRVENGAIFIVLASGFSANGRIPTRSASEGPRCTWVGMRRQCGILGCSSVRPGPRGRAPLARGPAFQRGPWPPRSTSSGPKTPCGRPWPNLAQLEHVAILIDRRVDPELRLDVKLSEVPVADALRQIAAQAHAATSVLGSVVYVGPPEAVRRLRTLAALREEEVRRLGPALARRFLQAKPLAWDDFATPRAILDQLAEEAGFDRRP